VELHEKPEAAETPLEEIPKLVEQLTKQMFEAARDLEFEKAAELRDRIRELENRQIRYA